MEKRWAFKRSEISKYRVAYYVLFWLVCWEHTLCIYFIIDNYYIYFYYWFIILLFEILSIQYIEIIIDAINWNFKLPKSFVPVLKSFCSLSFINFFSTIFRRWRCLVSRTDATNGQRGGVYCHQTRQREKRIDGAAGRGETEVRRSSFPFRRGIRE